VTLRLATYNVLHGMPVLGGVPTVPPDTIHALILRELLGYNHAKIRDYIPLLVTRTIRISLHSRL